MHKKIIKKIKERNLIIGVIGLGYVGLPIVIKFSLAGFKVIGIDTDIEKVDLLNNGKSYLHHFKNKEIKLAQEKGFKATQSFEEINNIDFIILCLPTPIKKNKAPDLSYIVSTMKNISPYLKKGQSISLESTSYPGTTEEEVLPLSLIHI